MSRSSFTIRKLRELAVKRLGALAAQLKTKDELYDALAELAHDALGLKEPIKARPKAADKEPAPKKPRKKAAAAKAPAAEAPAAEAPAAAAPAAKVPAAKVPAAKAPAAKAPAAKAPAAKAPAAKAPPEEPPRPVKVSVKQSPPAPAITSPQRLPKKPRRAAEREVVRDFFVPPGARALPASFGDDRVMLFPRDPGGIYVSWDLSPATWGHGGLRLVLRTHDGQEIWSQELHAAQGAVSLSGEFGGASIRAIVERNGSGLGASPAVLMPGTASAFAERWKVRVEAHARLPTSPEVVGPSVGPPELPGAVGEPSRLLSAQKRSGPGGAPSRLG